MDASQRVYVAPAAILGAAFLIGLALVGWGISARGQQNVITVTGSASQTATADQASWTITVSRTVPESLVAQASSQLAADSDAIGKYLKGKNLTEASVTVAPVAVMQNYSSNQLPPDYTVNSSVTVSTKDVTSIDTISHDIGSLNKQVSPGAIVSPQAPQYYVSTLPDLRVSLLGNAIKDARARAEEIAKSGQTKVGALQTASSGVVQVMSPTSITAEDYGSYDTSTIEKKVMVTARVSFYVK